MKETEMMEITATRYWKGKPDVNVFVVGQMTDKRILLADGAILKPHLNKQMSNGQMYKLEQKKEEAK